MTVNTHITGAYPGDVSRFLPSGQECQILLFFKFTIIIPKMHNTISMFKQFGNAIGDLLFPPVCHNCEQLIGAETPIPILCESCISALQSVPDSWIETRILAKMTPRHIDQMWAAFCFHDQIQHIAHAFKYKQMPDLARKTGRWIASQPNFPTFATTADMILPVPLHWKRRQIRGYNQSERLAAGLFPEYKCDTKFLKRKRYTQSQTKLKRTDRRKNVADAFVLRSPEKIAGKSVLLIDDVVTTGATLNECARTLKENGAVQVFAIAIATPVFEEEETAVNWDF